MLHGLRTVVFRVADLGAAKRWYAEILGKEPYFDEPFYVGFDVGGYELGLHPREDGPGGVGGSGAYWAVRDVDGALARLIAAGATALEPATEVGGGIVVGAVTDPFGNALGVIRNPHFRAEVGAPIATTGAEMSDRTVVVEGEVALSRAEVWRRWTTSDGLSEWITPNHRVELRVGGPYEWFFLMDEPEGRRGGEGNAVLAFLPERMLSFTWNAPPHLGTREAKTWVVVELADTEDGTHVRLTHTGWPAAGLDDPDTDWAETFAYFEGAWRQVIRALQASAAD